MSAANKLMEQMGYTGGMGDAQPPASPAPVAVLQDDKAAPHPEPAPPAVEIPETPEAAAPAIQEPEAQQQQQQQAQAEPTVEGAQATIEPPATPAVAAPSAVTEAPKVDEKSVLEFLSNSLGRKIESLDELNVPSPVMSDEERARQETERRNNVMAFALQEKLYSANDLQAYNKDINRANEDVALEIFASNYRASIDKDAGDEAIAEQFEIWSGANLDENAPLRLLRQREMAAMKESYIEGKHSKILTAESEYDTYQHAMQQGKQYTDTVNDVFSGFGNGKDPHTMSFDVDGQSFAFNVSADVVNATKERLMNEQGFKKLQGLDKGQIAETVKNALIVQNLPAILKTVAEAYHSKKVIEAGAEKHGIEPVRTVPYGADPVVVKKETKHADAIMQNAGYRGPVGAPA